MRFGTLVWKNLARRPSRTLLNLAALSAAVAAVVSLLGISQGFTKSFAGVYEAHSVDIVVSRQGAADRLSSSVDASIVERVRTVSGVARADGVLLETLSLEEQGVYGIPTMGIATGSWLLDDYKITQTSTTTQTSSRYSHGVTPHSLRSSRCCFGVTAHSLHWFLGHSILSSCAGGHSTVWGAAGPSQPRDVGQNIKSWKFPSPFLGISFLGTQHLIPRLLGLLGSQHILGSQQLRSHIGCLGSEQLGERPVGSVERPVGSEQLGRKPTIDDRTKPVKHFAIAYAQSETLGGQTDISEQLPKASVMLGIHLAERISAKPGDVISFFDEPYTVESIFQSTSTWENGSMIFPLQKLQELTDRKGQLTYINVVLESGLDAKEQAQVVSAIEKLDQKLLALPTQEFVDSDTRMQIAKAMAWMTSVVAVVVGSIGTLNTMLTSVLERTKEIGILRAIGWPRKRVFQMIVMESLLMAAVASVIGMVVALLLTRLLSQSSAAKGILSPEIDVSTLLTGGAIAIVVGLVGALLPAWRATRMLPTEAFREAS